MLGWSGWGRAARAIATIATLATAIAAVGALYMTNRSLDATRQQTALSEQGQYTDRFGRAVEQLASDKLDVRLGGIYALERLAQDSHRDAITISRLLGAFVREHSCSAGTPAVAAQRTRLPADIAAALTVLSARDVNRTARWVEVTGACLEHRDFEFDSLSNLNLDRVKLADTRFFAAVLRGVRLQRADLSGADLEYSEWLGVLANAAQFPKANLRSSVLHTSTFVGANFTEARLDFATRDGGRGEDGRVYLDATQPAPIVLDGPNFASANLTRASLTNMSIPQASFFRATLDGADFSRSNLQGADFRNRWAPSTEVSVDDVAPQPEQVRFDGADLTNAVFAGRDMRRMSLVDADLTNADLRGTDLRGVDLTRTNLTGAILDGAQR